MTEKERQLILQDLYARLPYGVKILHQSWNYEWDQELSTVEKVTGIDERFIYTKVIDTHNGEEYRDDKWPIDTFNDKPYLFPLSSMSEEQKKEYRDIISPALIASIEEVDEDENNFPSLISIAPDVVSIDWCNKNHFDYRD